jgi:hypothetical protein
MADETSNEVRIASPAQIAGLERASKQYAKRLHERQSARAADWLARAEIYGAFSKALLGQAQKESPELRSLFDAARNAKSKRVDVDEILRRPGVDPSKALLAQAKCNCSGAGSLRKYSGPRTRDWSGYGTGLSGWAPGPVNVGEDCVESQSGHVNQFNMGTGPFITQVGANFSPFINLSENATANSKSTASGRSMLGTLWTAPGNGFLSFSGSGSNSWLYTLDCAFEMAEVDAHIGTSFWDLGTGTGAPISQVDSGEVQVFGGQSNYTNQVQNGQSQFLVTSVSNAGSTCQGFPVVGGNNYILWIFFELNAFQGGGANSWPAFAMAFSVMDVFLESIDWTFSHELPIFRR